MIQHAHANKKLHKLLGEQQVINLFPDILQFLGKLKKYRQRARKKAAGMNSLTHKNDTLSHCENACE